MGYIIGNVQIQYIGLLIIYVLLWFGYIIEMLVLLWDIIEWKLDKNRKIIIIKN